MVMLSPTTPGSVQLSPRRPLNYRVEMESELKAYIYETTSTLEAETKMLGGIKADA
jgi:hypothetical protein